jgi:HD-GYP domain-containing protein (c-di-GMP phosphodiesterase class II)
MDDVITDLINPFRSLATALEERDQYTASHNNRTKLIALDIGKQCGLETLDLTLLMIAACMHDIGKIGIPDRILLKAGALDAEEWGIMKTHPEHGFRILNTVESPYATPVAGAVRHHHEAFDGGGYPDGKGGEDIPVLSRIIALADCYDAMATSRPYRPGKPHDDIMRVIYEDDEYKYDPYLRDKLTNCLVHSPFRAQNVET